MSPLPAQPTLIVEVAFANNASTPIASCTWTDITRDCMTIATSIGKQDATSSQAQAGRMTVRLANFDGRYSPFNTASPNYGPFTDGTDTGVLGLVPMKRVRVRAVWSAITYPVWHGFVESWQMVWPSEKEAYVDVAATDGFKQLNLRVMGSVYAETVRADKPAFWARMGDAQGSATATASIPDPSTGSPSYLGAVGAGVTLGGTAALALDANTSAAFNGTTSAVIDFATTPQLADGSGSFTAEMWVTTTDTTATTRSVAQHGYYNGARWSVVYTGSTHVLLLTVSAGPPFADNTVTATTTINDGQPHHLAFTMDAIHLLNDIWVDGVNLNTGVGGNIPGSLGPLLVGGDTNTGTSNWNGSSQDFAVYPGVLSSTQIIHHHTVGAAALAGQKTGARIGAILDFAGWPTADRTIDTGRTTLQGTALGQGGLTEIQTVEASEGPGLFFQAADGTATFYDRNHILTGAALTSQVTLGEGAEPYELAGTTVDMDDLQIWNIIPVSRANGATVQAVDTVSTARYGPRTLTGVTSLQMSTDAAATDLANYLLVRYATPGMQPHSITINPLSDANNLFPQVLGRQLLDRVTITRAPPGGGTPFSAQATIIYVTHTIDPAGGWRTTWTLSPYETIPFVVLDDVTFGVLDAGNRLYF